MIKTNRSIFEATIIASVITIALVAIQLLFTNVELNKIETAAVFFSFACTWLCTRQVRFSYVLAVIATSLLVVTFWQANLYGSMALNLYLIPTVIYGWFIWGKDSSPKPVQHVKSKNLFVYLAVTFVTWVGAYYLIHEVGGSMANLDGWLLIGTVLAQFLLDRKKIETWIVWILVDIVSIYVYFEAGLHLLAAQFFLFLVNAFIGYFLWKKTMENNNGDSTCRELVNV